jgi:hypothetical protein
MKNRPTFNLRHALYCVISEDEYNEFKFKKA